MYFNKIPHGLIFKLFFLHFRWHLIDMGKKQQQREKYSKLQWYNGETLVFPFYHLYSHVFFYQINSAFLVQIEASHLIYLTSIKHSHEIFSLLCWHWCWCYCFKETSQPAIWIIFIISNTETHTHTFDSICVILEHFGGPWTEAIQANQLFDTV